MNDEVLARLNIYPLIKKMAMVDLGCGVGTVARYAAKKFPLTTITGVTIVDAQITTGTALINKDGLSAQVGLVKDNFENSIFATESFHRAYAVESACHANGSNKELFVAEMARILKTGGKFCIADGFIKHDKKLPWFLIKFIKKYLTAGISPALATLMNLMQR